MVRWQNGLSKLLGRKVHTQERTRLLTEVGPEQGRAGTRALAVCEGQLVWPTGVSRKSISSLRR